VDYHVITAGHDYYNGVVSSLSISSAQITRHRGGGARDTSSNIKRGKVDSTAARLLGVRRMLVLLELSKAADLLPKSTSHSDVFVLIEDETLRLAQSALKIIHDCAKPVAAVDLFPHPRPNGRASASSAPRQIKAVFNTATFETTRQRLGLRLRQNKKSPIRRRQTSLQLKLCHQFARKIECSSGRNRCPTPV